MPIFLFRHERPSDPDDPLNDQNIKDRYYGSNDPVADKIMKRAETLPSLNPPEDPLITTLYIGGLGDESEANPITEQDLRNHFYQYGEIRQITVVPKQGCAFIQVNTIMTSLLTHNVAHSTRHSFRPKTNNQPLKKFLSLAFS